MLSRRAFAASSLLVAGLGGAAWSAPAFAQGGADLNVSPKRLVFKQNARIDSVLIFNSGDAAATYNISCIDRLMTVDGGLHALGGADLKPDVAALAGKVRSARALVLFTPRRVTLQPGETQTVRIRVTRPADLAPGEYRTHLTVTAVPPQDQGLTAEQAGQAAPTEMSVRLIPLFSISIPIIVRQGPDDIRGGLRNL